MHDLDTKSVMNGTQLRTLIVGLGALPYHGANARRSSLQTLLVRVGCGGALGLLSRFDALYQGSLAEARQPFTLIHSPFRAGVKRGGVAKDEVSAQEG
ncbi:hypothetical protein [Prosthecobacter sp.]|uniref:hypothetical protein n=1 Tax=Prosthecobacter sp. TaxID=1965333 RepID=UPI0026009AAF|nr:hypothetical protein [Prosthecobacter sp.]